MVDVRNRQPALLVHALHAAEAGAGDGRAVVAIVAADEDVLGRLVLHRPEMSDHAQDGVVRFRTRVRIEHVIEVVRREFGQLGREHDRWLGGATEKAVVVRELVHLLRGDHAQFLATITDVDAPQPGEGVEQLVAFGIPDIAAFATDQDARALLGQRGIVVERMQMMVGVELLQESGVECIHERLRIIF